MEKKFKNVYEMFEHTVQSNGEKNAYFSKDREWVPTSWTKLKSDVDSFAMALLKSGLQKGDTVSILSSNRLCWPIADLGTIAAGGISIGLYPTSSPEQCEYILNHSASRFVLVDTLPQLQKIMKIKKNVPSLKYILVAEKGVVITDRNILEKEDPESLERPAAQNLVDLEFFLQTGEKCREEMWEKYQQIAHASAWDDPIIIVYTSGTTGNPKGACLSNRYVISSCDSLFHLSSECLKAVSPEIMKKYEHDTFVTLSFLPYCHVGERISGMYNRIYSGTCSYLVDNVAELYRCMMEVNPHTFGGLPRFFEKIYAKIMNDVETGNGYNKEDFQKAMEINKRAKACRVEKTPLPDKLRQEMEWADENIGRKVRANFGSRILFCSSGAAPIPKEVLETFEYAGNLVILEGYGLTEFVCAAFSTPFAHKTESVGKPMLGCVAKIAEDGEILLSGPQIFSGYYKDEAATRESLTDDGWLMTGDIGKLDEEGFLFITGRKKEFIKTSTGKKIAPLYLENLCKRNHLISNVMVYGDNKNYLVALITLNQVEMVAYAQSRRIAYKEYAQLTQSKEIREIVEKIVQEVNQKVSTTEQIKKYTILSKDFSIEANEITPTGKVKRNVVSEKFKSLIEGMYAQ